jgi:hypothetical protein
MRRSLATPVRKPTLPVSLTSTSCCLTRLGRPSCCSAPPVHQSLLAGCPTSLPRSSTSPARPPTRARVLPDHPNLDPGPLSDSTHPADCHWPPWRSRSAPAKAFAQSRPKPCVGRDPTDCRYPRRGWLPTMDYYLGPLSMDPLQILWSVEPVQWCVQSAVDPGSLP